MRVVVHSEHRPADLPRAELASRNASRSIMLLTSMSSMKDSMVMGACGFALNIFFVFSQATNSRYIAYERHEEQSVSSARRRCLAA